MILGVFFAILALSVGLNGHVIQQHASDSTEANLDSRAPGMKFVHPGVFVDRTQLRRMRSMVKDGQQPWSNAYAAMMKHPYAKVTDPKPRENVNCGAYSKPDNGCTDERRDAMAAYTNALAWFTKKDQAKADIAISIMNAWANTIKEHTGGNAPLQAAWAASLWARAGEIIRYSDAGWKEEDIATFSTMLKKVYLPIVQNGSDKPNNWELILMEASISIAVFVHNRVVYKSSLERFINSASYYIYLKSDGSEPLLPPGMTRETLLKRWWWGQDTFQEDGMVMETCRDLMHSSYGIASISHVAETVRIQGRDLYSEDTGNRLRHALEFLTKYDNKRGTEQAPDWLCNGNVTKNIKDMTEPGYSNLSDKYDMPNTKQFTAAARPAHADSLFIAWETLTHATGEVDV
ncbi:hypothetical protein H634G_10110 [Metarhizium anisopliae BRIP 53293]|uniref:Alginate lyase domain-containing protein n=1 Tax=Metarhizium anisopliae BRIP 53293 TaxID=1291518 RepID=A0A0D9NL34_METAN|nr:hypothetical protein H634G_10110 [Metarhizium anisopliae BRIP 53293]KJK94961.1 hypothetical protein H633G_01187 [Metarhizium anisopliae BRIP 53284]